IFLDAVDCVRADRLVAAKLKRKGEALEIEDRTIDLSAYRQVIVVGAGKASAAMAEAIEPILGDRLTGGVVVTKDGHSRPTKTIRILEAGHPIPDEGSLAAGRAIFDTVNSAGKGDLVISLLSGGAS